MLIVITPLKSGNVTVVYISNKIKPVAFIAFLKVIVTFQGVHGQSEQHKRQEFSFSILKSQVTSSCA